MGGARVMHGRGIRTELESVNLNESDKFGNIGVDEKTILN
jgi:hypothetical protein